MECSRCKFLQKELDNTRKELHEKIHAFNFLNIELLSARSKIKDLKDIIKRLKKKI